jgi:hypothetical protein
VEQRSSSLSAGAGIRGAGGVAKAPWSERQEPSRAADNISVVDAAGYIVRIALPMPASPGNIALDPSPR